LRDLRSIRARVDDEAAHAAIDEAIHHVAHARGSHEWWRNSPVICCSLAVLLGIASHVAEACCAMPSAWRATPPASARRAPRPAAQGDRRIGRSDQPSQILRQKPPGGPRTKPWRLADAINKMAEANNDTATGTHDFPVRGKGVGERTA
jgi:hypothetical protein